MASLRKQVKDLGISPKRRQQDFDPEDDTFTKQSASDDESESDDGSVQENAGREHYETVGKSKLRKTEKTRLDEKKYGGQAVSRDKIFQDDADFDALAPEEDEEDEDPFAAPANGVSGSESEEGIDEMNDVDNLRKGKDIIGEIATDEEIESDEAFEEGEEDKFRGKGFVFRGSGKGLKSLPIPDSDEENDDDDDESLEDSDVFDEADSDVDMEDVDEISEEEDSNLEGSQDDDEDDEDEDDTNEEELNVHPRPSIAKPAGISDREALKALISNETAALASSLSASLSADAQKGAAVKKQYQTFDRLLDARIKLQKGLIASNEISSNSDITNDEAQDAIKKAEDAALKLYATIESLRHTILEANTTNSTSSASDQTSTKKRKRPVPPTSTTSTSELWSRFTKLESQSLPTRNQTLDKWSTKTRSAAPITSTNSSSKLSNTYQAPSKLSTVLAAYLQTETPKLLASHSSAVTTPSAVPYDDSAFYQSLLRDLITSRSVTTSSSTNPQSIPVLPLKLHPSGNTAKTRRIDTKASKGRKVRYTVHEKLENWMAGEGRGNSVGQWNDGAVREFFGSLLGQRGMLGEENEAVDGGEDGEDREVEALRLFST